MSKGDDENRVGMCNVFISLCVCMLLCSVSVCICLLCVVVTSIIIVGCRLIDIVGNLSKSYIVWQEIFDNGVKVCSQLLVY